MPLQDAEQFFRRGVARLAENRAGEAVHHFLSAMQLERERGVRRPEMRYLSYYGVAVALARGPLPEAMRACETAVEGQSDNPDLHLNLGRVYLRAGEPGRALQAVTSGLQLDPSHRALRALLRTIERRRRPPLRFLTRDHPVNRVLGRLRASLRAHENAPPAAGGERGFSAVGTAEERSYQR